jgi:hypothetical protein
MTSVRATPSAENRILKAQLKGQLKLTDAERATLAEIGHRLGRRLSPRLASVARPDTILAWYRAGPHPTSGETFETIEDQRAAKPAAAA